MRGSPASSASFLRGPSTTSSAASSQPDSAHHSSSAGYPSPNAAPSASLTTTSETRDSILASFPLCPSYWLLAAATQLGGSREEAESRAKRAWVAGKWAQATAAKRISSPNRSLAISQQNRYWCVLHCQNCDCPAVFTSSSGAAGRQRLQQELASCRRTFYKTVMSQMARRMQPMRHCKSSWIEV